VPAVACQAYRAWILLCQDGYEGQVSAGGSLAASELAFGPLRQASLL